MKRAEPGVGFLLRRASALGSPVAVLPVAVWGTERALVKGKFFPQRTPIRVRYGEVFTPSLTAARDDQGIADQVAARVAALLPPQYRGVYEK
jgi:1-acyl-sn-glycerol-3-phosphate acyltransferase